MSLIISGKKEEIFFFSSYILYLHANILQMSFYYKYYAGMMYNVIIGICLLLLIIGEVCAGKVNLRVFFGMAIVSMLTVLILDSGNGMSYILFVLIYGFCARKISMEKIVNVTIIISSYLLAFIILSSYLGIIDNYVLYTTSGRIRYYLGFRYALYAPTIVFNIVALVIYKYKERLRYSQMAILFTLNLYMYKKTHSRLTFYTTIVLLVICIMMKYRSSRLIKNIFVNVTMVFSFLFSFGLSFFLCSIYSPSSRWMIGLDQILGKRLYLGNLSIKKHGIKLFGQTIKYVGNGLDSNGNRLDGTYFYVDNFYIQILQRYGLIFTVIVLVALTIGMFACWKHDYYLLIIVSVVALHGMIDDLILILGFNTFWIPIIVLLLNKGRMHESSIMEKESNSKQGISG